MIKQNSSLVIIPAYNESESIGPVIDAIRKHAPKTDIAMINDGSVDGTASIAKAKGIVVLNLPFNLGIGGAVQTGYQFADEMGYDIAVQVDADGQHPAEAIVSLIEAVRDDEADMVIGSRYIEKSEPEPSFPRAVAKWLLAAVISILTGYKITDSSSGFRCANRKVIQLFARMYPRDYPEPETVALLLREKFRVKEIPVRMNHRSAGESSITFSKGIYYVIKVVLAIAINMFEKRVLSEEP